MANKFNCGNGTYSISECVNGQTPLAYYDALTQIGLQKSLREGTILCYNETGIEGLFSQMASALGADKRMVKATEFWWTEICSEEVITTKVKKSGSSVPAAGATVTVVIAASSHSSNGAFSVPRQGHRAYIKELNGQAADITAVNRSVTGSHSVTLKPINNQVLNLTVFENYTLLVDPLKYYTKGDTNCIPTHGFVPNPPALRKGYVQMFEDGLCIHQDEINGYAYDVEFRVLKGIDPKTNKKIDYWNVPTLTNKLTDAWMDSRNINTLFGQRDDVTKKGFDGLVPTAEREGMFTRKYDPSSGVSLKTHLFNMIRALRKTNGCKEYMLLHDFGFGMDWTDSFGQLIKESGQNINYELFGSGGEGSRNFNWFEFKDFTAFNYKFRTYQIDLFDSMRYGHFLSNFAMLMPACRFKDTNGKTVPPVTYVNVEGSEPASEKKIWSYSKIDQGCRTVDVFVQDTFGMEIHCASKLGVMRKAVC